MATDPALTPVRSQAIWAAWVVFALLLVPLLGQWEWLYLACVTGSALLLSLATRPMRHPGDGSTRDVAMIAVFYVAVVVLMRLAFVVFGTERTTGLFLSFAGALLLGVVGPVIYTIRRADFHDSCHGQAPAVALCERAVATRTASASATGKPSRPSWMRRTRCSSALLSSWATATRRSGC